MYRIRVFRPGMKSGYEHAAAPGDSNCVIGHRGISLHN